MILITLCRFFFRLLPHDTRPHEVNVTVSGRPENIWCFAGNAVEQAVKEVERGADRVVVTSSTAVLPADIPQRVKRLAYGRSVEMIASIWRPRLQLVFVPRQVVTSSIIEEVAGR